LVEFVGGGITSHLTVRVCGSGSVRENRNAPNDAQIAVYADPLERRCPGCSPFQNRGMP
jgi:hypothetical protein